MVPVTGTGGAPSYAVVVPTLGRPSLRACLDALAASGGPRPTRVVIVHDRPGEDGTVPHLSVPEALRPYTTVVPGRARGPAAARNAGVRLAGPARWIVFLDDDVVPSDTWAEDLARDLASASEDTAAVTARIDVPLPQDRRPTDWERCTAGLATARWITADMAFRRAALDASGGFDERFRRAYREDADLALRLLGGGWTLAAGTRRTTHPVRPADPWVSVRQQAGNADDVLMARLHGPDWRDRAGAPRGRFARHLAVVAAGVGALGCAAAGLPRAAAGCGALWLAGTAEFAIARVAPGPRTREEITRMVLTSAVIPTAAVWHRLRGQIVHRNALPRGPARSPAAGPAPADVPRRAEAAS
ncbi:glycosyltransferase family 2 protein [Streptomyces lateritius]|uniref:Glycosyltransferase family 2 protein n=1 Tax=Streptomyces lateritius TaxID=67313 RepID=A0ABW6YGK0_9ACTN